MRIERIFLRELALPLRTPFVTSFGAITQRRVILVEVFDDAGRRGLGEACPISPPAYTEESAGTAWHLLTEYLGPLVLEKDWESPEALSDALSVVRRNYAAKAGLETAVWDLYAQAQGHSIVETLSGRHRDVEIGTVIGIPDSVDDLIARAKKALAAGFRRIKIKVEPGWDLVPLRALRHHLGDFPLAVDANASYTLDDLEHLKRFDAFDLQMIEQPLGWEDLIDHAQLQGALRTPICLDESITSIESARQALALGSCRIINIKIGRVGGLTAARAIHDLCARHHVPVWCGGLLESGVGRTYSIALATLPNFTLPADLSPPQGYLKEDILTSPVTFTDPGALQAPQGPGLGVTLCEKTVARYTVKVHALGRRPTRRSSNV